MDKARSAIVVVVDRLGSGFLGPYGNTWVDSPTWNRLAGESLLFESALTDTVCLETVYRSYWQGLHAAVPGQPQTPTFPQQATEQGIDTLLITDCERVGQHPLARDFASGTALSRTETPVEARSIDETRSGLLFAAAMDELATRSHPYCLWLHAAAMNAAWDSPYAIREAFADEEDPPPPDLVSPPNYTLDAHVDPDELLGLSHAYAGEVCALDRVLDAFLDAVSQLPTADQTLLIVTSPRGFPLGEHGKVGTAGDHLFGETLHVPLLVRLADRHCASRRCRSLVQPADLGATLYDWFGLLAPDDHWGTSLLAPATIDPKRSLVAVADGEQALRTPIWHFRSQPPTSPLLFAKPDDRWEVNEVADRCPDVVAELAAALERFAGQVQSSRSPCLPQLADEFVIEAR